jgi:2-iminobutanoate/2-iminopropanoate deaminase
MEEDALPKIVIETNEAPEAIGPYSQAINTGNLIFTSGQLPIDPETKELVGKNIEEQTKQCFENLKKILSAGESSLDHVIKMNVFLKDLNDFPLMNQIYGTFFKNVLPARSCIQIARLPMDAKIEIEAVALCLVV